MVDVGQCCDVEQLIECGLVFEVVCEIDYVVCVDCCIFEMCCVVVGGCLVEIVLVVFVDYVWLCGCDGDDYVVVVVCVLCEYVDLVGEQVVGVVEFLVVQYELVVLF